VKGIQICSKIGPGPLQGGDNHKNVKMGWGHLKIFFSRTTGPILPDLAQIIIGGRGFLFVQIKGIALLQGEIIVNEQKYTESLKNLLQNQQANFNQIWYKLFLGVQIKGQVLFKGEMITKM
jgi:hypothetical protein